MKPTQKNKTASKNEDGFSRSQHVINEDNPTNKNKQKRRQSKK